MDRFVKNIPSELPYGIKHNRLSIHVDGPSAFDAIHRLIRNAKSRLYIQIYSLSEDATGWEIAKALAAKAKEGVDVRVLYEVCLTNQKMPTDYAKYSTLNMYKLKTYWYKLVKEHIQDVLHDESGWFVFRKNPKIIDYLVASGVHVAKENAFHRNGNNKGTSVFLWNPAKTTLRFLRNEIEFSHRKIIIADCDKGMIGGMNFEDLYALENGWHDVMVLVEGPAVSDMQREFAKSWKSATGELLDIEYSRDLTSEYFCDFKYPDAHMTLVLPSDRNNRNIKNILFRMIENARNNLFVEHAYLNDDEAVDLFLHVARKKVRTILIVSDVTDIGIYDEINRRAANKMIKAGAEVYLYPVDRGRRLMHMKVISIDGFWTTIGSANISYRSLNYDQEMNIAVYSHYFARQVEEAIFYKDIAKSQKMTLTLRQKWYYSSLIFLAKRVI